jgi:hypothetical protein
MSRLIDGLKKLNQTAPQPMGFRTSRSAATPPTILIIAKLKIDGTVSPLKSVPGADAILLHADEPGLTAKNLQKVAKPLKDTPWGVYLNESEDDATALVAAGCDFLLISPTSKIIAVPQDEKTGKILQVESSMDDGLLRAVNDLPVDAVLIIDTFDDSDPLVWHQLMILRHLTAFISKPVLVPVPATISESELKALWDAGIDGVVAEANVTGGDLKALREIAGKLTPRSARKTGKMDVVLPRVGGAAPTIPPPDEEEEEDE